MQANFLLMITFYLWVMGKVIADGKREDAVEERLLRVEKMLEKLLAAVRVVYHHHH